METIRSLIKKQFIFLLFVFFFGGCSTIEQKVILKEPAYLPAKRNTILTDQLGCFGDMLADYSTILNPVNSRVKPLTISIIDVKDATGISSAENREIPSNMTDIAIGVASNIGGRLRIAHIPSMMEIQNMAYVAGVTEKHDSYLGNFKFKHYNSDILLYGALTEYDRVISNKKRDYNLGAEIGGGSSETDVNLSNSSVTNLARLTMDFRAVYTMTGNVANHSSSTNTVYLHQHGKDFSLGLSINGQAIGLARSYTEVDARHAAIRLLIELGLIESIGRFSEVPYWKCFSKLENSKNMNDFMTKDQDLIDKVKMDYEFGQYLDYSTPDLYPANSDLLNLPRRESSQAIGFFAIKEKEESKKIITIKNIEFTDIDTANEKKGCETLLMYYPEKECTVLKLHKIIGKKEKRERIISLYRKNTEKFLNMKDEQILNALHNNFIDNKIIKPTDSIDSSSMYIALWYNAPVKDGGRWNSGAIQ